MAVADAVRTTSKRVLPFARWRGSVTAREKVSLEPNELGPDSTEWLVDPVDGRLVRRGGSTIVIDTISSGQLPTAGATEAKFTALARAHQFIPLHSPSFTANGEAAAYVIADEVNKQGTLVWVDPDTGAFNQLGKDFNQGATGHYRQDGSAGEVRFKIIPMIAEAAGIDYHRLHSSSARKYPLAGVRRAMELSSGLYLPGSQSCPYWLDKRRNPTGTTGTEKTRGAPWGLAMPLWAPATTVPGAVAKAAGNWTGGNRFYEAWAFKFADGSIGPPFRISTTATTPAKGGLVTVGTAANYYLYRTVSGIPLGPKDGPAGPCVARIGYRSLQSDSAAALPDASKLYPFAIIEDNTSTSMVDYNGSDVGLTTSADDLNNHTWPPRAQVAVAVNGRAILGGKIRQNPYALVIAPTGGGASRDLNLADDDTTGLYGTVFYHVRIVSGASGHLYLKRTSGGVTNTLDIDFATYTTLQLVVDKINETLYTDAYDEWAAQIVPGVDGNVPSQYLRSTSATGDEDDATVNTAPADATTLNVRAYCPTFYFAPAFTEAYLATLPTDEAGIWMSDGDAASGAGRYSTFRIRVGDRVFPPGHGVGKFMGMEPCIGQFGTVAIVFYERGRFALRNIKGGGSGDNADFQLVVIDPIHGCVSHLSCFSGNGYAGCVGQDGVWVTEGPGTGLNLSRDHYNQFPAPGQLSGDLAYAINTDAVLAAAGSDTHTWAGVVGDRIRVRYRTVGVASTYQDSGLDYWFADGPAGSGLAVLQRGPGEPYGWCCPVRTQRVAVMGIITDSNGRHCYAWQNTDSGSTGTGAVQEVDKNLAADDNGTDFTSAGYTACVVAGDFMEMGVLEADPAWRKNQGTTDSGLLITIWGDVDRGTAIASITLGTSGASVFKRQRIRLGMAARGNLQCVEALIQDNGSGSGAVDFRGLPLTVEDKSAETRY